MIGILLTVPHGGSGDDTGALPVACHLHRLLKRAGVEVRTLVNRRPRAEVDMNRPEGRGTAFRNAAGALLLDTVGLLIDVHSFPDGDVRFGAHDIVLLETRDVTSPRFCRWYVAALREGARALGVEDVSVAVMPAQYTDDVVIHAQEIGQPSSRLMLAEHNAGGLPALYAGMHLYAILCLFGQPEVEASEYEGEPNEDAAEPKTGKLLGKPSIVNRPDYFRFAPDSPTDIVKRDLRGHPATARS